MRRDTLARRVALVAAATTGCGVVMGLHLALDAPARGHEAPIAKHLIEELTGFWTAGLLFFPLRGLVLAWRLDGPRWRRSLALHLAAVPLFAVTHTVMMGASRRVAFPLLGLGAYDYGDLRWRLLMEVPTQALGYALATAGVLLLARTREASARELRAAQALGALRQARLENLEHRLRPHFLFNALNTISATMYADPGAADEQVGHLAELLRASLRASPEHELPLASELELLEHYLAIERARFGADLEIRVDIAPPALAWRVPQLLLQPLVENAVRHGRAGVDGRGKIVVSGRVEDDVLELVVRDDGGGAGGSFAPGLGLSVTEERLRLLYGDAARLVAGPAAGGFEVRLRIPRPSIGAGCA